MSEATQSLPERPKEAEPPAAAGGDGDAAGPSKNALKKLAKEKEKAEKAAKRAEQERAQKAAAEANDTSKHLYGSLPDGLPSPEVKLGELISLRDLAAGREVDC